MGKAIGDILPYALAAAISVVPIIAIILMLVSPKAKTNATGFAVGYVFGFAVVVTVVLLLAAGSNYSSGSGPSQTVSVVQLLLGILLLVAAAGEWRKRPRAGERPELPKWMSTIDAFTAGKSALVGLVLSAVNPKNLAMSAAAGLAIAQAEISTGQEVGAAIIYVLLGSATVLGPVVVYLVEQDRAARILGEWRVWLADNNAVLTGLLLLVFAVVLIGKGISGLSS